ncbi:enoyl-CoA hydratase-related protein [Streptacidiphilus fuscans]|uniref:Enoyl-CoA hydratase/isomerase family protein n=1 Tax=Streptacidiphilus fuscans TaxID=2789292 RepID=A0A931B7N8_9ACTN|nr:enoyl-CoA hydratase-related protein [Streptacidiphilus fuscans]MBF9071949.1 enoyl-CoA hydratase/isomerase family protein [Streptacidiphilus fuscans]
MGTPSTADTVLAERRGAVLVLTLNRPERLNAWTYALEGRYFDLLDEAEADLDVRAVVVTGAGRGFCAGADLDDLAAAGNADAETLATQFPARAAARPRTRPLTLRKPLIAAVNGAAAGLGLVQALYCDIRFATPEAKFTTAFARRGLIAEYGVAWLLPRLVGTSRATDLLLSSRVVRGQEALAMGLVDFVAEPDQLLDAAVAYATDLAQNCSPWSMSVIKQQLQHSLDSTFAASVAEADALMLEGFQRPDVREGVASYLEHRAPAFPPLEPKAVDPKVLT